MNHYYAKSDSQVSVANDCYMILSNGQSVQITAEMIAQVCKQLLTQCGK